MADTKATETVKNAADQVKAQAEKAQVEGTKAMREGLEKTTASLAEMNAAGKENLDAMVASATAAQKGAEALGTQAMDYSKSSWEQSVSAAQSMAKARSIQELLELQTSYAKSAMENYMTGVNKMTETLTSSVKDSFQPINARVTAQVEKLQAAR